jgi:hypothetical protein
MKTFAIALQALWLLAACAMPQTVVRTTDTRPSLAIEGAPSGSILVVDGNVVGDATVVDGQPNTLRVEPGTHEVEIRDAGGRVIYRQRVFVESELKTIQVH